MPAAANASRLGEPQDGAVEVVVELVALRLDLADDRLGGLPRRRQWRMSAASKPSVFRPSSRSVRSALGRVEVEGEEVQPALGDRGRVLRAHRARGGVARVDQRLVGMRLVVGGERRAQHHGLAADLDAAAGPTPVGHPVGQRADEHGDVVAGRPVAARDRPREPPVLVDERQRQPVELGHHDHRLAREAGEEGLDLLGLGRLLEREHRPRVAHRRVQHRRRADLLERVRVGRELRDARRSARAARPRSRRTPRRPPRRAAVVRVAQRDDLIGEFLDPLAGAHPPQANRIAGQSRRRAAGGRCCARRGRSRGRAARRWPDAGRRPARPRRSGRRPTPDGRPAASPVGDCGAPIAGSHESCERRRACKLRPRSSEVASHSSRNGAARRRSRKKT